MPINATQLRKDVYHILDQVLKTGKPIDIERKGQVLKLVPPKKKKSILSRLKKQSCLVEPIEFYDHIDWSHEWNPDNNI